jgi:hypothetical protein
MLRKFSILRTPKLPFIIPVIPNISECIQKLSTTSKKSDVWEAYSNSEKFQLGKSTINLTNYNDSTLGIIDERNRKMGEQLEKEGHTCVRYLESYPCQVVWCEQEKCVGLRKNYVPYNDDDDDLPEYMKDSDDEIDRDIDALNMIDIRNCFDEMNRKLAEKLIQKGHTCIYVDNSSYPCFLKWCENFEQCLDKRSE